MRPVKLTMSAFGPYAATTEIDFEALGTSGVYLVCGDTGSGKTMIFDAICFALFGEASGDSKGGARSTSSFRSDYAANTAKTFVELLFEYRGKRYRVTRNPDYTRAKERGEGETKQTAGAEIEFPDGRVVSGVRKVNAAVEDLLGIDCEQFKQIVMLAQGEFRKLLTADTDSREVIFRKLFGTEIYEEIQERLAEESRKLERENARVKTQIATLADRAVFPPESDEAGELAERQGRLGLLGEWLNQALERQLSRDKPEYERLDGEVESLREKWSESNALLKQAEGRPALEREAQSLREASAKLAEGEPALAEALEAERGKAGRRTGLVEQAARIAGTFAKYEGLQAATQALQDARKATVQARALAGERAKLDDEVACAVEQLAAELSALDGADVRHEKAKAAIDAAQRAVDDARKTLANAEDLAKKQVEALRASQSLEAVQARRDKALKARHDADGVLSDATRKLRGFEGAEAALVEKEAAYGTAKRKLDDAKALLDQRAALAADGAAAKAPYDAALSALHAAEAAHDADLAALQHLQKRQRAGRAGLLAADLQEGQPCPVCGSLHHPEPAVADIAIPSDDDVDKAAEREAKSQQAAVAASVTAEKLLAVYGEKTALLEAFDEAHGGPSGLDELAGAARTALDAAQAEKGAAAARLAEAKKAQEELDAARASHADAATALDAAEREFSAAREAVIAAENALSALRESFGTIDEEVARSGFEAATSRLEEARKQGVAAEGDVRALTLKRQQLADARAKAAQMHSLHEEAKQAARTAAEAESLAEGRVAHLRSDLEFASLDEARKEEGRLREEAAGLQKALEAAEKAVRDSKAQQHTNAELLKAAERRLASIPEVDIEATKRQMGQYQQKAEELKAAAAKLKTRIDANESCRDGLTSALRKAGGIEERYGRVKLIADAATGNLVGKPKIRFEAYVQAIYFDKVIAAANARLKMLTAGQFELIRHSEGGGNAKAGLGLFVIDSYTGRARDASSLSGGESFQASLCLALGLSDIVQAHAGGIEFDTMFVDEGFGSLDQAALGNAITLLSDLSGGTKLVGIISHVEDLKANIPKKIIVRKGRAGSTADVELS